jgi:hypothetical protein
MELGSISYNWNLSILIKGLEINEKPRKRKIEALYEKNLSEKVQDTKI